MPYGSNILSSAEGLPVKLVDGTSEPLNVPMLMSRTSQTLSVPTTIGLYTITVTNATAPIVGDVIELINGDESIQATITAVAVALTTLVTLDVPLPFVFPIGSTVSTASKNLLVNGSVTPVVFSIVPTAVQSGVFTRIVTILNSTSSMDFSGFGGGAALTRGCVIRKKNSNGTYTNLANFKSNGELSQLGFEVTYNTPKGGNVTHGLLARLTWAGQENQGVTVKLEGSIGETLELVIQDNLTISNTTFKMYAQGRRLT